jgi:hypothetical protein
MKTRWCSDEEGWGRGLSIGNTDAICPSWKVSRHECSKRIAPPSTNRCAFLQRFRDPVGMMPAPGAPSVQMMRLTVEVLPLEEENAHGPYRDHALAVFKGRKFALPVRWDDTLGQVWSQIEQRYKTNYLDPQQAA